MKLTELPQELLDIAINFLPYADAKSLALTFNRKVTPSCVTRVQPWINTSLTKDRLESLFEPDHARTWVTPDAERLREFRERLEIDEDTDIRTSVSAKMDMSHMQFTGDLKWMREVRGEDGERLSYYFTAAEFEAIQDCLPVLLCEVEANGLSLPGGFGEFMAGAMWDRIVQSSQLLRYKFFLSQYGLYRLVLYDPHGGSGGVGGAARVNTNDGDGDGDGDGNEEDDDILDFETQRLLNPTDAFLLPFSESYDRHHWKALFFEPSNQQRQRSICGVVSVPSRSLDFFEDPETFTGFDAMVKVSRLRRDQIGVVAASFEEFLAGAYYTNWMAYCLEEGYVEVDGMREFVLQNWAQ